LKVTRQDGLLALDFPRDIFEKVATPAAITEGIGITPLETYRGKTDYMAIVSTQSEVEGIRPDFGKISQLDARGLIVTAPGDNCDFVSRFFAPQSGIDEDPVTGSSHTTLTPYWAEKLGKKTLSAMQLSARKGHLQCTDKGERIEISGKAVTYLVGEIVV
jgi:predicted PhzF superfamily epimerase YddE/YHI9